MKSHSIVFFILLFTHTLVYGKITKTTSLPIQEDTLSKYYLTIELQTLHSTHNNYFNGISASFNKTLSKKLSLGVGAEYSYSPLHHDNGWVLRDLKFIPLYIDGRLKVLNNLKKVSPFIQASTGMSFIHYSKQDSDTSTNHYHVSQRGLYAYWGTGVRFNTSRHFKPYIALGFKGFHMSLNVWEVNPHGMVYKVGIMF